MMALSCAEARDLASDLLDGELSPELERAVDEHVTGCPTCPALYRALLAVHRELERLRHEEEPGEGRRYMRSQEWDQRYATTDLVWGAGPNRFLVGEVADLPPGRALDVGCGEGRNAIWLAELGWQVTGVDFSEVGLDKARSLAADRGVEVTWVRADLLDYQPDHGAFELVIVMYIQLPPAQLAAVMKRASAALAPGGTLLVVGHDLLNLSQGYGGPQNPEVLFTPADIERDLPGLGIERAERVLRPVTVDGREVTAIDALVRAKKPLVAR